MIGLIKECSVATYTVLIHAHVAKGIVELPFMYFLEIQEKGIFPNAITYNTLINSLSKERRMGQAYRFFDEIEAKQIFPNKYMYTILINKNYDMAIGRRP